MGAELSQTIIVALVAGAITAIGWLANYAYAKRTDRYKQELAARLAHVERQLERLYGPLVFLVHEGEASFSDLLDTLKRRHVFSSSGSISEEDLPIWLFWIDHDLMPRNAAIQALLSSQSHLIVGDKLADSYIEFIKHYNTWKVNHARWKVDGVRYSWRSKTNWPTGFAAEVKQSFEMLKQEQKRLQGHGVAVSRNHRSRVGRGHPQRPADA
jgi:hypothetical protein